MVSFSSYYIDVDAESGLCSVDLGVLYRHFVEISRQQFNSAAEVSRIMSYLGDQTKFNIFRKSQKSLPTDASLRSGSALPRVPFHSI